MQAAGLVNDHTIDCFRYAELSRLDNSTPGLS
jgi:3-methyladenine DNA glycosylase Tag